MYIYILNDWQVKTSDKKRRDFLISSRVTLFHSAEGQLYVIKNRDTGISGRIS